jgi:hypothetical protein
MESQCLSGMDEGERVDRSLLRPPVNPSNFDLQLLSQFNRSQENLICHV